MELEKRKALLTRVEDGVRDYFETNAYAFYGDDLMFDCLIYRSYRVHFLVTEYGEIKMFVAIGGQLFSLSILCLEGDNLLTDTCDDALIHNFGVLDRYLRYRISGMQKETFSIV
jgi:hypothetical protein